MSAPFPTPPHRWPWLRLAGLLLLALAVGGAWQPVLRFQAAREVRAAGFDYPGWTEVWETVRQDWRTLFDRETWRVDPSAELMDADKADRLRTLDDLAPAFRRLAIENLSIRSCPRLENVDALQDLPALKNLDLYECTALRNVDGLRGLPGLQVLNLNQCTGLENVDALRTCPSLDSVTLFNCRKLTPESVAALKAALPANSILDPDGRQR